MPRATRRSRSPKGRRVILEPIDAKGWTPEFVEMFFRGPPVPDAFPDRPPQGKAEERDRGGV